MVVLAGLVLTLPSLAGDKIGPVIPEAKEKATQEYGCVGPVTDMRKNHMNYILHQRDKTVQEGIRTTDHSLAECINCHVTPEEDGKFARFGEDQHFCSSCHNYSAVNVDCFDCHRDTPEQSNFKHSLTDKPNPHDKDIAFNQKDTLTKDTLNVLTSGGAEK